MEIQQISNAQALVQHPTGVSRAEIENVYPNALVEHGPKHPLAHVSILLNNAPHTMQMIIPVNVWLRRVVPLALLARTQRVHVLLIAPIIHMGTLGLKYVNNIVHFLILVTLECGYVWHRA